MRSGTTVGTAALAFVMVVLLPVRVEAGSTDPAPEADCDESPGGCTFCADDLMTCAATVTTCTSTLATCSTDLGGCNENFATCTSTLTTCSTDLGTCNQNFATCGTDLATCNTDLDACETALAASATKFPATGQGIGTPPIAGEDGNPAYGAALSYTPDPAMGTALKVTDENTGLQWEVKTTAVGSGSNAADLHDVDNTYPWLGSCSIGGAECGTDADCGGGGSVCNAGDGQAASPNGLTIFEWVVALNAASYAGHNDWRVPNVRELHSIVDYGRTDPTIDPAFGSTGSTNYWSSTVLESLSITGWAVGFFSGNTFGFGKSSPLFVRAVRGGSLSQP